MRIFKKTAGHAAFTLLEILIAISLVALIGTGIYKAFSSGMSLYERAQAQKTYSTMLLALDKFSEDLGNSYSASDIVFKGTPDEVVFYTHETRYFLLSPSEAKDIEKGSFFPIRKTVYRYDAGTKKIFRYEHNYKTENPSVSTVILEGIDNMRFSYKFYDEKIKGYKFDSVADKPPIAIKIEAVLQTYSGKYLPYKFMVDIPLTN
jgi:prepilin-type N-terminal cleavage/methylation domain-containing protein